jgi:cell division protein FtsQ
MEQRFMTQHVIKKISIYKTTNGDLNVNITQRKPMVRVINKHNQGYYIDSDGQLLPLSRNYTSHVLIMNGNISEPFEIAPNVRIMDWATNEDSAQPPLICKLYELARYITDDPFWNAQITQVYVEGPDNIELIPRIGSHTVQFGSADDLETKFTKLKLFYERALPAEGWNKYKLINLKYKNQIVCTKR